MVTCQPKTCQVSKAGYQSHGTQITAPVAQTARNRATSINKLGRISQLCWPLKFSDRHQTTSSWLCGKTSHTRQSAIWSSLTTPWQVNRCTKLNAIPKTKTCNRGQSHLAESFKSSTSDKGLCPDFVNCDSCKSPQSNSRAKWVPWVAALTMLVRDSSPMEFTN